MHYPQYRKLDVPIAIGIDRYYKIIDDRHFVEASKRNGQWHFEQIEAKQFPEMLRIKDMIDETFSYVKMSAEEIAAIFPES